jgi:cell wall-associated NlpC family hydrolase
MKWGHSSFPGKRGQACLALMLASLLAGCASSPPPRQPPAPQWQGSGGGAEVRVNDALADLALQLRGSPYRYGGATRDGFDCSGLVFYAHRHFGLIVPRTSRDQAKAAREVEERKLRRGDLVFFKIGSRHVNHVGIFIGDRQFVHAPGAGKPVTVNSLDDDYYSLRFSSAGRFWDRGL